jgi:transcriptional regulator with XRE-family HTH domain
MKIKQNTSNIKNKFASLLASDDDEQIKRDAYILMANFLSEIEGLYLEKGLNRKKLAENIGTSASYLTQVFTGSKPLNFMTLAKIKKKLGLQFEVKASLVSDEKKTDFSYEDISFLNGLRVVHSSLEPHNFEDFKPSNDISIKNISPQQKSNQKYEIAL